MPDHPDRRDQEPRVRMRRMVVALSIALSIPTTAVQLFGRSADHSDYGTHLDIIDHLQHGHLEVPHFVFHGVVAALGLVLSNPIATLLVIALAQVALGLLVFRVACDAFEVGQRDGARAARLALGTTAALLISAPIGLFTFPHLFIGYITTTTYHNPTIQLLKPLALVLFLRVHDDVLAEPPASRDSSGLVRLAILSIVTTMAKPSFSIVAVPALVMMMLLYRGRLPLRRALVTLAVLGFAVGAVVVWQMLFLRHADSGDEGIAFQPFFVALSFEPNRRLLVAKLLLSVAFPAIALICNRRAALADRRLVFSYACFVVSLLYYLLLAERGTRVYHGNFGWGVMVSLFLVFVATSAMLARRATELRTTRGPWLTLLVHAVSGLVWLAASNGLLGHLCDDGWGNWCW